MLSVGPRSVAVVRSVDKASVGVWVDPAVHAAECARFERYIVCGPRDGDCDIWSGAIGADGYSLHFITRGAWDSACGPTGMCWR